MVSTYGDYCMISCDFYSPWVIVIGFDSWWLVNYFLWFLLTMSDCYWFRHTVIAAWVLVIYIHHEWLLLVSTHGYWWMTSCDLYSSWVAVIDFDTRWLLHDFLWFLSIMSDCDWFRHTVISAWPLVISIHHEWLLLISTHDD